MPEVVVTASSGLDPDAAFGRLQQFERMAEFSDAVRSVEVGEDEGRRTSSWEANFRNGILIWSEYDEIDPANRRITFTRRDGDPLAFDGFWQVEAAPEGSRVEFRAEFDLGMPSLADVVDPIAAQTLHDNVANVMRGVLDGRREAGDEIANDATPAHRD